MSIDQNHAGSNGSSAFTFTAEGPSAHQFYNEQVLPLLTADLVYTHASHEWHKSGDTWRGSCPWHNSKSGTSFTITPSKLLWYCSGCCFGGGPIQYIHRLNRGDGRPRGEDFRVCVKALADQVGLDMPKRKLTDAEWREAQRMETRRAMLQTVSVYCQGILWDEAGEPARDYLHTRGYDDEAILDLGLGLYADAREIEKYLLTIFDQAEINTSGVIHAKLSGYIDFPWHDDRGQMLTLYGTWPGKSPPGKKPKKMALANPEEDGEDWDASKRSPYCLDRALRAGHKDLVLVEGLTDGSLLHALGDTRVISPVCNKLAHDQVETLRRRGIQSVTICLDPDQGGKAGTPSCIKMLAGVGIAPYVAPWLPEELDPDEYVLKHGVPAWRELIDQAIHGFRWTAQQIVAGCKTDRDRDRAVKAADKFAAEMGERWTDELHRHFWPVIRETTGANPDRLKEHKSEPTTPATGSNEKRVTPAPRSRIKLVAECQPFPVHTLPAPLDDYCRQGAIALGCDVSYVALPVLAAVAGALGHTRCVVLKRGWCEPPIIWSAVVGDSGTKKTPAFRLAVPPLEKVQARWLKDYNEQHEQYEKDYATWEAKKKKDGPEKAGDKPKKPRKQRCLVDDITIETVALTLAENPRGILLATDELDTWFSSFGRYKGKASGSDRPHWLKLWQAAPSFVDRRTSGTLYIPPAGVSITGGIQPGILARAMSPDHLDSGLAARLLLAMPTKLPKLWTEVEIDPDCERAYEELLFRLLKLEQSPGEGDDDNARPFRLRLSSAAKAAWVAHYNRWALVQASVEGDLAAAFAKLEAYAARLSLLHHVVTCAGLDVDDRQFEIGIKSMEAGITLAMWFAHEARRIYATLAESDDERDLRRQVEWIKGRGGRTTAKELQRSNNRKYRSAEEAEAALNRLVSAGAGEWRERPTSEKGGRPTRDFTLTIPHDETDETPFDACQGTDDDGSPPAHLHDDTADETPSNLQKQAVCGGFVLRRADNVSANEAATEATADEWEVSSDACTTKPDETLPFNGVSSDTEGFV